MSIDLRNLTILRELPVLSYRLLHVIYHPDNSAGCRREKHFRRQAFFALSIPWRFDLSSLHHETAEASKDYRSLFSKVFSAFSRTPYQCATPNHSEVGI